MIFTAQAIKDHPDVRLTKGGLVLIALLAGGDYDKVRLPGMHALLQLNKASRESKNSARILGMLWLVVASVNSSWQYTKGVPMKKFAPISPIGEPTLIKSFTQTPEGSCVTSTIHSIYRLTSQICR